MPPAALRSREGWKPPFGCFPWTLVPRCSCRPWGAANARARAVAGPRSRNGTPRRDPSSSARRRAQPGRTGDRGGLFPRVLVPCRASVERARLRRTRPRHRHGAARRRRADHSPRHGPRRPDRPTSPEAGRALGEQCCPRQHVESRHRSRPDRARTLARGARDTRRDARSLFWDHIDHHASLARRTRTAGRASVAALALFARSTNCCRMLLPDMIRDAHDAIAGAGDQDERRRVRAVAGDLYHLVQRLLAHIAEPELHALAVERGRAMSEMADMPETLALAAWSSAIAVSAQGYFDEAVRIARAGSQLIDPLVRTGDSAALGLQGALQLGAAAAMGFAGNRDVASEYLTSASSSAERLPVGECHRQSGFDRTSAMIMSVIVDVANGNVDDAVRRGERLSPATIPSRVRRSRFLMELAVAHSRRGERFAGIHYFGSALDESREAIAPIPWVANLASELTAMAPPTLHGKAVKLAGRARFSVPA